MSTSRWGTVFARLVAALAGVSASVTFASIPPPAQADDDYAGIPADLRDLLLVTDGPRCGSVVIFSADESAGNQYYCLGGSNHF